MHLGDLDTTKEVDCDENVCADRVQVFYPSKIVYPRMYSKPIRYKNDLGMIKLDRAATITGLYGRQLLKKDSVSIFISNIDGTSQIGCAPFAYHMATC